MRHPSQAPLLTWWGLVSGFFKISWISQSIFIFIDTVQGLALSDI